MAKKANKKVKQLYIVDMILIVTWGIAIATGFLAIPSFVNDMDSFNVFSRLHAVSSRIGAAVIIIHIYQHLEQIRSYMGLKSKKSENKMNAK